MKFQNRNSKAAKLTAALVAQMRERYASSDCTQADLAREFGITVVHVGRILRGEVWQTAEMPAPGQLQTKAMLERLQGVQKDVELNRDLGLDGYGRPLLGADVRPQQPPPSPLEGGEGAVESTGTADRLAAEAALRDANALTRELEMLPSVLDKAKEFTGR